MTTTYGTGADETFNGTSGDDLILAAGGNDTVSGGDGEDDLYGESGDDVLSGDGGDDYLDGGRGNDRLNGGGGNDFLAGGLGTDSFDGGDGIDRGLLDFRGASSGVVFHFVDGRTYSTSYGMKSLLHVENVAVTGSYHDDEMTGGTHDDELYGSYGDDNLFGGDGNDYLTGDVGSDAVYGGKGDDGIYSEDRAGLPNDTLIDGGAGIDDATISRSTSSVGINFDISDPAVEQLADGTIVRSIERVTFFAGGGDDSLTGGALDDFLYGDGGDDILIGGAGSDELLGLAGNDYLDGGSGSDKLHGGAGDDIFRIDASGDSITEFEGDGSDEVRTSLASYALGPNLEILTGIGAAPQSLTGNSAANVLDGGAGADTMKGAAGNDIYVVDNGGDKAVETSAAGGTDTVRSAIAFTLGAHLENLVLTGGAAVSGRGNALANILTGNGAANFLNGGAGADVMTGGAGNDGYAVDHAGDQVIEASGGGTDRVSSAISYTLGDHVEHLTLTGLAHVDGTGNALGNTMAGNGARNRLEGGDGGDGIRGGGSIDMLFGGAGDDRLYGGTGSDSLTGGGGKDGFYFDTALGATNVDAIADFSVASDTIFLDRDVFTGLAADGTLAAGAFRAGTAAADADDRILYDAASGEIRYDPDGVGGAAAILFAEVAPGTALTHADFVGYI